MSEKAEPQGEMYARPGIGIGARLESRRPGGIPQARWDTGMNFKHVAKYEMGPQYRPFFWVLFRPLCFWVFLA